jgi:hypothetical protein
MGHVKEKEMADHTTFAVDWEEIIAGSNTSW